MRYVTTENMDRPEHEGDVAHWQSEISPDQAQCAVTHPHFARVFIIDSDNSSKNRVVGALIKVNYVGFSLPEGSRIIIHASTS